MRPRSSWRSLTFQLTLPDGKVVTCWTKDRENIRRDVMLTGRVMLVRSSDGRDVYDYVDLTSAEGKAIEPAARHVTDE